MRRAGGGETIYPPEEVCPREAMRTPGRQPRILLTNVKQLDLLLTRQQDVELFADARLDFLVFDEAHTFTGALGAETACPIRRLRAFCNAGAGRTTCVATSATIVDRKEPQAARNFAARFFGVVPGALKVRTIGPKHCTRPCPATMVYRLNEELETPRALDEPPPALERHVGRPVTEAEILAWLTLGVAARREERPLLRPVVHGFVRGIGGAVVSFPEDATGPELWLAAEDGTAPEASGEHHAHFPVTTCTTCGQHYYVTFLKDFSFTGRQPGGRESGGGRGSIGGRRSRGGRHEQERRKYLRSPAAGARRSAATCCGRWRYATPISSMPRTSPTRRICASSSASPCKGWSSAATAADGRTTGVRGPSCCAAAYSFGS